MKLTHQISAMLYGGNGHIVSIGYCLTHPRAERVSTIYLAAKDYLRTWRARI